MPKHSTIYVDGFNLYYGALRRGPYKWLNLERFFTLLRQDDEIRKIWYFTALIDGPNRANQETYLRALRTTPLVGIQHGRYKQKIVRCNVTNCRYRGVREFRAPEEKGTDVKIALQMLDDAYQGSCDRMVLVSGDEDLLPAVELIKQRFPHLSMTVYVPARDPRRAAATRLRKASDKHKTLPLALLSAAQFPPTITTPSGETIQKPTSW
ncbi:MAG: NYN domain-containing protein [Truepera sp.]|nr:NYN domain-containing protein [Truepera sp.]